jgi:MFS family permease
MNTHFHRLKYIPFSVWGLGIATFLLNSSSVIVFGLCALYMKNHLGASIATIVVFEGYVEACANFTKVFSGVLSDYLRRRKNLMVVGFAMATVARPILALFPAVEAVLIARFMDRIGNGIQSAPRDALVGDISPHDIRGACFGLRQALATAGSLFGGVLSYTAMSQSGNDYIFTFWVASIPATLGLLILLFTVKEPDPKDADFDENDSAQKKIKRHPIRIEDLKRMGRSYWILMGIAGLFFIGRISESFLLLNAETTFKMPAADVQLIIMFYNASNALASFPIGILSDRMRRMNILLLGFVVLISADLILGFTSNKNLMFLGVALWGIQIGVTQSMFLTIISEKVPADLRGTGIGMFYLITSLALALGGRVAGYFAGNYGVQDTFLMSGAAALLAFFALMLFSLKRKKHHAH